MCHKKNTNSSRSETGVFALLDCVFGTLCLLHYGIETSHLYSWRVFWRHFCLSRAVAHSDSCFFAPCINILTYLLIYLITYLHTKLKASSFSCSRDERCPEMLKWLCDYNHTEACWWYSWPLSKFEDSNFCCFGDMKEDQKLKLGVIWGGFYHPTSCLISALDRTNMTSYLPLYIKQAGESNLKLVCVPQWMPCGPRSETLAYNYTHIT